MKMMAVMVAASIAAVLMATAGKATAQEMAPRPRLITVTGTAEVNEAPDQVVLTIGVQSRDRELAVAKAGNDASSRKVIGMATAAGVAPKDIQTSQLQMSPNYSGEKVPRFLAFEVSQTIEITLKDLSKYDALMTKLLEGGANRVDDVTFEIGETRKYKDEARSKAIQAAKEKASAMAGELGQTLGKPWEIVEQDAKSCYSSASFAANAVVGGVADRNSDEEKESTVAPGHVTIRASVRVSFQLE